MTIETETPSGYLIMGAIEPDLSQITLDPELIVEIDAQTTSGNKAEETLIQLSDVVMTIYEVNGEVINPNPVAHLFSGGDPRFESDPKPFPNIDYRITDATEAFMEDGVVCFWVINYQFPGDEDLLTDHDPLVEQFGEGESHHNTDQVERLVKLCLDGETPELTDTPPIYLKLVDAETSRNWEGIVRLDDRGFLLVTDKFPETILGFVPYPED
jgi:hypothetical protein